MTKINISSGYDFEQDYGYSRAVRVDPFIFVSGTTARPPALCGDAYEQFVGAIDLVKAALAEAGATLDQVVRTVVYLVDLSDIDLVARAHRETFGLIRPASTLVQVAALTPNEARVEIEVTAVLQGDR